MRKIWLSLKILIFASLVQIPAFGAESQNTANDFFRIFDTIDSTFYKTAMGWVSGAEDIAKKTFFLLALIDIILIGIKYLLKKDEIKEIFSSFVTKIIVLCGCLSLIQYAPYFVEDVFLKSFETAGSRITGIPMLSPTGLIDSGFSLISKLLAKLDMTSILAPFNSLVIVLAIVTLLYSFLVIAWELLTTKIEAYILMFGGLFFLAFSGSEFTRRYSYSYLQYCFATGTKLFIAYLIVACGTSITNQVDGIINSIPDFVTDLNSLMIICASYLTFATIARKITPMAHGFITGVTATSSSNHMALLGTALTAAATFHKNAIASRAYGAGENAFEAGKSFGGKGFKEAPDLENKMGKSFQQDPPPPKSSSPTPPKEE